MVAAASEVLPLTQQVAFWKERAEKAEATELALRRLLWLRHGCDGLYGDDGEMQCGHCIIDFKRAAVGDIESRFIEINRRAFLESK